MDHAGNFNRSHRPQALKSAWGRRISIVTLWAVHTLTHSCQHCLFLSILGHKDYRSSQQLPVSISSANLVSANLFDCLNFWPVSVSLDITLECEMFLFCMNSLPMAVTFSVAGYCSMKSCRHTYSNMIPHTHSPLLLEFCTPELSSVTRFIGPHTGFWSFLVVFLGVFFRFWPFKALNTTR